MKIYVIRDTTGTTIAAFRKKKDAIKENARLRAWHLSETEGIFDGLEEVELL